MGEINEWLTGLPNIDDITPLNKNLIPPELLNAFNIKPEPCRSSGDLTRACEDTLFSIRGGGGGGSHSHSPNNNFQPFDQTQKPTEQINGHDDDDVDEVEIDDDDDDEGGDGDGDVSDSKKPRRNVSPEDADSSAAAAAAKTSKRTRLVWTPQLHKRFVDVVAHLGIKSAVPKTIMMMMNVEGLTRENVASHLQKYRLYLKRMHGNNVNGPSGPDNGSGFGPGPSGSGGNENSSENGNRVPVPVQVPMMGMGMGYGNGYETHQHSNHYNLHHHHHHHHQFSNGMNMNMMQAGNNGNNYGSVVSYHQHHPVGDK